MDYLKILDNLADEYGFNLIEMAMGFMVSLEEIDQYIIGTTSIINLHDDIMGFKKKLPKGLREKLFELASPSKIWANPRNWH